jgi:hypothetical protein
MAERWSDVLIKGGRFAELMLASVKYAEDSTLLNLDKIQFGKLFTELVKKQKVDARDDILLLAIPRAASAVYTLRSKKRVAHFKLIDPSRFDAFLVINSLRWMLAQFIMVLSQKTEEEVHRILDSLTEKHVPLIEEFEGGEIVVLTRNMGMKKQILLVLYKHYPRRLENDELVYMLKPRYR